MVKRTGHGALLEGNSLVQERYARLAPWALYKQRTSCITVERPSFNIETVETCSFNRR